MATKPTAPSSDHDETVVLKAPVAGSTPDPFDSDKTVVRRTPAAEPITPKPKGFSMSFDHPEAADLDATVKVAPVREMPGLAAAADPLVKRKPGAAATPLAQPASEAAPAKGGMLKWILGGAAAIVVIILGVAYLLGSNELAAPKVTILKQGTLIEPAQPAGTAPAPAVAPEPPAAAPPPPAAQAAAPVAPEPAPAPAAAVVAPPPPQAPPVIAAAPAPKAPPTAATVAAAAAAKKAALEKESLAKQAQTSAPVVTQAPPPPPPPPPVQAAPAPLPAPVAAPRIEAPPAPVAPPAPAAPSNPNQVCEGRWLLALQNCLAEQCVKPAYSKHAVCVEKRSIEQRRQEEQQQSR